jgi:glycosyltransferase involved in cell wall biosynthesis
MDKILFLMNMAPKYVESSYKLFDKELDVLWLFGENDTDIKEMDHALLKEVHVLPVRKLFKGAYYLKGVYKYAFRKDVQNYILIGQPALLTTWILPRLLKLFYPSRKVLFWTHGWYGKEGKFKTFIKKAFYKPADYILTYGNYARKLMIDVGFEPDKVLAIHNSLNHDAQVALRKTLLPSRIYKDHFKNDYPVLIFIGRLTPVKNLGLLIEAVKNLKEKGHFYNVVFVGDGTERRNLEDKVVEVGISDNVWFYGACYDEKTNAELIFNADLCVAPGNIGLTAMHVLVFGTPALTHNDFKWQMPEFEAIHEGITGCFFERNNVDSLADAINRWFDDKKNIRDEVREACYQEIDENWTPEYELKVLNKALKL